MYSRKEVESLLKNYDTMNDVKPGSGVHVRMADVRKAWKNLTYDQQLVLFWIGVANEKNGYFAESYSKALTSLTEGMNASK